VVVGRVVVVDRVVVAAGKVESVADEEEERVRQNLESWARVPRGQICENNDNKINCEGVYRNLGNETFCFTSKCYPKTAFVLSKSILPWPES
jgi:hypothetical protein